MKLAFWRADERLRKEIEEVRAENLSLKREAEFLRAQLIQLRVWPSEEKGNMGFMVSAFIANNTVKVLADAPAQQREDFVNRIARVLVDHAVKGIFHVSRHGTMQALIFEPPMKRAIDGKIKSRVGAVFEIERGQLAGEHKVV